MGERREMRGGGGSEPLGRSLTLGGRFLKLASI